MSYLDKLKKQATVVKKQQQTAKDQQTQQEVKFEQQVKPALNRIQPYLIDLVEQLNVVQPDVRTGFKLGGFGEIDNLLQTNYELILQTDTDFLRQKNYAKKQPEVVNYKPKSGFALQFVCKADYPIRIIKKTLREIPLQRDYLHKHGFQFKFEEEKTADGKFKRGLFLLRPNVTTKLIFQGNVEDACIEMIAVNFNLLGKQHYMINCKDVNDKFLDELAKYIVREPHCLAIHEKNTDLIKPKKTRTVNKPAKKLQTSDLNVKLPETLSQDDDEFNQWLRQTQQNLEQQSSKTKKSGLFSLLKIGG